MNYRALIPAAWIVLATGCSSRVPVDSEVIPPSKILDFNFLYSENCAGCHGEEGKGGVAIGLSDPVYLAIANDAAIRKVTAQGIVGTAMPAFASNAGGLLTDQQIDVIVTGIRSHWAKPDELRDANPPPYAAQTPGDPERGRNVYATYCSRCHGADGRGGQRASSIVDPSYLTLVSDQSLRTTVIVGRREMGAPDWRGDVPGKPMSAENVSDVVAWLAAQRTGGIR